MATLTIAKPIQYYHPKYSFEMLIKEIPEIDKRNKIYNSHITFKNGVPCLDFPMRAKFIFDKAETPTFRGARLTDNFDEASSELKGEIIIPLRLIDTDDIISVGLLSLCTSQYIGIEGNTASNFGYKDYKNLEVSECKDIRRYYTHIDLNSPIRKDIISYYNSNPELTQKELIDYLRDYIGDSEVFICLKKYLRIQYVGTCRCYLKPYYYLEYYLPDSIDLPFKCAIKSICPICLDQHNIQQIVEGQKVRRSNDKGVNYFCTGMGVGMGALIGGPIGAAIGGVAGKLIGNHAEKTNSSTCTYEFKCPKCLHRWTEERSKID